MTQLSTGGYIRHRDRMVQESVFEDLQNTLIACRWMNGVTSRPVLDPNDPGAGWQTVTTTDADVLKLVGDRDDGTIAKLVLIDYFPGTGDDDNNAGSSRRTEKNTFAVDNGITGQPVYLELGSNMMEQTYTFAMAFYANSDAVAMAVMNDLRDRYAGRIVSDDHLNLFNFNDPAYTNSTPPVCRMEIENFRYTMSTDQVSPWEVHLYFGELTITDIVDSFGPE